MANQFEEQLKQTQKQLDSVSSCFCLAKWTQVTIHLQNGHTHSCHHPKTHQVPLEELKDNPSALHNTEYKKKMRKMMQEGERPPECAYCWRVEDSETEQFSDRIIKSAQDWSTTRFDEIIKNDYSHNIAPSYVEVSFGNACNVGCLYCFPHISSTIYNDYVKNGHYPTIHPPTLETLKRNGTDPIKPGSPNPYVEAFWKWFPTIKDNLHVFRITGGEPLINPNTFRVLDDVIQNPMPNAQVAINSNLCIPEKNFLNFLEKLDQIQQGVHVKRFEVYTSVDTYGTHAEYIRQGMDYKVMMDRTDFLLERYPDLQVHIMCTFNALSVIRFKDLLKDVLELKHKHCRENRHRFSIDISYLYHPTHFSLKILPKEYKSYLEESLQFIQDNLADNEKTGFNYAELNKMKRLLDWFVGLNNEEDEFYHMFRHDFYLVIKEVDRRKNIDFKKLCPEYSDLLDQCFESGALRTPCQIKDSEYSILSMKQVRKESHTTE